MKLSVSHCIFAIFLDKMTTTTDNQVRMNLLSEDFILQQLNRNRLNSQSSKCDGNEIGSREPVNMEIDVTDVGLVKPVDGGWGWMIVAGSFMVMFLLDGICLSYGLFLNALEDSFENVPKLQMMFAGSLITGCYLIMGKDLLGEFCFFCAP